jgi:hypothetical protein
MAPGSITHRYVALGDGRLIIDRSPYDTWRFVWVPHERGREIVLRYGNEDDYPSDSVNAVYEWAKQQSWGRRSSQRLFDALCKQIERPE